MTRTRTAVLAFAVTMAGLSTPAWTAEPSAEARTKVATAVALANIATAEKDGDALLVAAKLLATSDPVAQPGAAMKDGKPTLYDVGELVMRAKEMGADPAKADAVASSATAATGQARSEGHWYYSCDNNNNCAWIYVGW